MECRTTVRQIKPAKAQMQKEYTKNPKQNKWKGKNKLELNSVKNIKQKWSNIQQTHGPKDLPFCLFSTTGEQAGW